MVVMKKIKALLSRKKISNQEEILDKIRELEKEYHSKKIIETEYKQKQRSLELEFMCISLLGAIIKHIEEIKSFKEQNNDFLQEKSKSISSELTKIENSLKEKKMAHESGKLSVENWFVYLKEKNSEVIDLLYEVKNEARKEKMKKTKAIMALLEKKEKDKELEEILLDFKKTKKKDKKRF